MDKINVKLPYNEMFGREDVQKIRPDLDIGHNIRTIRKEKGMTQDQVVAKMHLRGINLSKSTYAKLETNRMNIKVSELVALKKIFSLDSFDAFFRGLEEESNRSL